MTSILPERYQVFALVMGFEPTCCVFRERSLTHSATRAWSPRSDFHRHTLALEASDFSIHWEWYEAGRAAGFRLAAILRKTSVIQGLNYPSLCKGRPPSSTTSCVRRWLRPCCHACLRTVFRTYWRSLPTHASLRLLFFGSSMPPTSRRRETP